MCQKLQKVTYSCGHRIKILRGEALFCLFAGDDRFHILNYLYAQREKECPRCKVVQQMIEEGNVQPRAELQQVVEKKYAKTTAAKLEAEAKNLIDKVHDAFYNLTEDEINQLNVLVKERITFYFQPGNMKPDSTDMTSRIKPTLLLAILELPVVFDRAELIRFFGDLWFNDSSIKSEREYRELLRISWRAGPAYAKTLYHSLNGRPISLGSDEVTEETTVE
ncbi:hypothetical protein NPX13_g4891 [Xylaria arbuscula]|uniref:Uncharacterized protein n=1 Tax=Xylaria arbuscula TaxID=114810 RepID=A0A9W8TLH9_9PEZI|nr:hypothetical protein NPX13_g4891 [Xylaria arbuscula]